jgi:hypothetical protein
MPNLHAPPHHRQVGTPTFAGAVAIDQNPDFLTRALSPDSPRKDQKLIVLPTKTINLREMAGSSNQWTASHDAGSHLHHRNSRFPAAVKPIPEGLPRAMEHHGNTGAGMQQARHCENELFGYFATVPRFTFWPFGYCSLILPSATASIDS